MPGEFPVSLIHNLLDVTTEDVRQLVAIHALIRMSIFEKEHVVKELDNETLQDNDEWVLSEDVNGLDSDNEETNNSGFDSDEDSGEGVEQNVNRFENHTDSNLHMWELIETKEDEIAIEQGKK